MEESTVIDYINKLPSHRTTTFLSLDTSEQTKAVFSAIETLNEYCGESKVTARIAALQTLFEVEAEYEEYAKLKRQGAQSASYGDTSVNFEETGSTFISPQVVAILTSGGKTSAGAVGRLV